MLYVAYGSGREAPLVEDEVNGTFRLTTPRSVEEVITFGPFHLNRALALRFDNGTEYTRFFTP